MYYLAAFVRSCLVAWRPAAVALAQAGGVVIGIGTTAPDASAALDIVSSTKGALAPRVSSAAAIASPAKGLIVYQTGSPAGFYYNAGTATTPDWRPVVAAATNGLPQTGTSMGLGGTLTQATTLAQGSNTLSLTGGRLLVQPGTDASLGVQVGDNSSAGNLILQPLSGANAGFSFLGFNGYYNGGEQRINTNKNRWRLGVDQRANVDNFFLDTYKGTSYPVTLLTSTSSGSIGIGTSSPGQKLEVVF